MEDQGVKVTYPDHYKRIRTRMFTQIHNQEYWREDPMINQSLEWKRIKVYSMKISLRTLGSLMKAMI